MRSQLFFITGATGHTGRKAVEFLLERGHTVRAFVHKKDEQSSQLQKRGAEIAVGDLLDFMTIRPALEGVSGAYFVYPTRCATSCARTDQLAWWTRVTSLAR